LLASRRNQSVEVLDLKKCKVKKELGSVGILRKKEKTYLID